MQQFVERLCNLVEYHQSLGNHVEAGNAFVLYGKLLGWSDERRVPRVAGFPEEEERKRKERVLYLSIACFDKGKCWEKAIQVLNEMEMFYRDNFIYRPLPDVLVGFSFYFLNVCC
jgi:hypothetical protein